MKFFLATVLVLGMVLPALGQTKTDFNEFGVYFDEGGESNSISADPNSFVDAYLVLKNPSESGQIRFWQASVAGQPDDSYLGPALIGGVPRLGTNHLMPMAGEFGIGFMVYCSEPQLLWLEPVTVLADLRIYLEGETNPFEIYVCYNFNLAYTTEEYNFWDPWDPEIMVFCGRTSGDQNMPVAVINGPAPVQTANGTWDAIKAQFRGFDH